MAKVSMVSVVIPVYNKERYLPACLDSVLGQTHKQLEVICVDDASVDSSISILKDYSSRYPSITVHQLSQNRGAGAARNIGRELATGDYLFFLDADDTIPANGIEKLVAAANETETDLVIGQLGWLKDGQDSVVTKPDKQRSQEYAVTSVAESEYLQSIPGCHCCNLYRKQFLLAEDIDYPEDLTYGEDQLFQALAILKSRRVTIIDDIVYFYHHYREGSLTQKEPTLKNHLDDIEYQRRMARAFVEQELADAGRRLLQRWSYPIREYWVKMPGVLTRKEVNLVFSAFRSVVKEFGVTPWNHSTPDHHRRLLELALAGKDEQALELLNSAEFELA